MKERGGEGGRPLSKLYDFLQEPTTNCTMNGFTEISECSKSKDSTQKTRYFKSKSQITWPP